jgi:hypothetical protein
MRNHKENMASISNPRHTARLTSLLLVEERLSEAEYFLRKMLSARGNPFSYYLNAFLAASRSVTFLLQKEYSKVDGFAGWWAQERVTLAADAAACFFLELRNYSQKEGRISLVGTTIGGRNRRLRWSYRFAGTAKAVPSELLNRDVVDCGREHLAKLARVVLRFSDRFSFHSCPGRALTPAGVRALGIDLDHIDEAYGYPRGWTRIAAGGGDDERIQCAATLVDTVDFGAIRRVAQLKPRRKASCGSDFEERLAVSIVSAIERRRDRSC